MRGGGFPVSIISQNTRLLFRQQMAGRIEGARADRLSWWTHWASLSEVYMPRRYKWFITPNQYNRGSQQNGFIVNPIGVSSARNCSAGMLSGMASPLRPWFKLSTGIPALDDSYAVKIWLSQVEAQLYRIFAESNFYTSIGTAFSDLVIFGSACMLEYEDFDDVVRFYNPCMGEFFFFVDDKQRVSAVGREFTMTVSQMVDRFGLDNVSESTRQAYKAGGQQRSLEHVICHLVEPNTMLWSDADARMTGLVPDVFKYRECFWDKASNGTEFLEVSGLHESCAIGGRWDIVSNDAYGRSPGMDAYPDVRQLQTETRRKAEAIDKVVRPPMVGSVSMKNEPSSTLPGSITYVPQLDSKDGYRAAYQIDPHLQWLIEDIKECEARVRELLFNDLFLMISQLDTVRTATEIDARREEKLIMLGPVIERTQNELLDPAVERTFAIASRIRGVFPIAPPELQGVNLKVQYVSMLAEAQRAASTAAIERFLGFVGNLMGVHPEAGDIPDWDEALREYGNRLNVPPQVINALKVTLAMREARAAKEQQQENMQVTAAGVQGAALLAKSGLMGQQGQAA